MRISWMTYLVLVGLVLLDISGLAQNASLSGRVTWKSSGKSSAETEILLKFTPFKTQTGADGSFELKNIPEGSYIVVAFTLGLKSTEKEIVLKPGNNVLHFELDSVAEVLEEFSVIAESGSGFGLMHRRSIEGMDIYAGKKNEVVVLDETNANMATNNSRQIFSRVAGLNIWESDRAGLQLDIGGRGLSPNRTSNFNTRQNGYDMAADALGYPESYYTPPSEAIEQIDVIRGAASLQYGTQFGGVINFKLRGPEPTKKFSLTTSQTLGSFGLFNSFNSIGGTVKNTGYYAFFNYKRGDSWRPNSQFESYTGYAQVVQQFGKKFSLKAEYTGMRYLAQQPGGLTDEMFESDPTQSIRARNWFQVNWNILALTLEYRLSHKWRMEMRNFGLFASREALGVLGFINRPDHGGPRDLLSDQYRNYGNETRLVHTYKFLGNSSNLLVGMRYYRGFTTRKQGLGSSASDADFTFNNPDDLEHSDYNFPSQNVSFFAENIWQVTPRWSITPGMRYENIITQADGYYKLRTYDLAGGILVDTNMQDHQHFHRSFVIFGLGSSWKWKQNTDVYANISQNYRAVNFNDMRVNNPNLVVDPNLGDERGFSADLGIRGTLKDKVVFDASLFYINYDNRIGSVLQVDESTLRLYRLRTNIANSRNYGVEVFAEAELLRLLRKNSKESKWGLSWFINSTLQDARYVASEESAFRDKKVEHVPNLILRSGITGKWNSFKLTYQLSYTSKQYTDATNTEYVVTAVVGEVPAYYVMDLSGKYTWKKFTLAAGVNNLSNNTYFTRRAEGYPGPGIIPADPINFYTSLSFKW